MEDIQNIKKEPTTEHEWADWLQQEKKLFSQVYALKPTNLIAEQRREREISTDYEGREILELLQNAADAAKDSQQHGRVRIELNSSGLIVANTGKEFSADGVSSLQLANISPKRNKEKQLIGSKGLGFRAVLNWSRQPIIRSGSLGLAYNEVFASEQILSLAKKYQNIADALAVEKSRSTLLLPFPLQITHDTSKEYLNIHFVERCDALLSDGFDTVIAMPFDRATSFKNAITQLNELRPEFLLFTEWLKEIHFSIEGYEDKKWKVKSNKCSDHVTLVEEKLNTETISTWSLHRHNGIIPLEFLQDDNSANAFEIVLALKKNGLVEPGQLYSFFPTSIPMPLSVLCHATLELEQNRKHLKEENIGNKYVLQQLAEYLLTVAVEQAHESGDRFRGIDLINSRKNFTDDLIYFEKILSRQVMFKSIVPCLGGNLCPPSEATSLHINTYEFLPVNTFARLAVARDDGDHQFYKKLGIKNLSPKDFFQCLDQIHNKTLFQRAELITGLINSNVSKEYFYSRLLLDSSGKEGVIGDTVFPNDLAKEDIELPEWADVKLLHSELFSELKVLLAERGIKGVRSITKALEPFGLKEYSLGALIFGLIRSSNIAIDTMPENEDEIRTELLETIFLLYIENDIQQSQTSFPQNAHIRLKNQTGKWVQSASLYLGEGFSFSGKIMQKFLQNKPQCLINYALSFSNLSDDENVLIQFFLWLRVEKWPKTVEIDENIADFDKFTLSSIQYPAKFDDYVVENLNQISQFKPTKIKSVEHLDFILEAESDVILAWLTKDPNFNAVCKPSVSNCTFGVKQGKSRNFRYYRGELPSYVLWKIQHTFWLNGSDGRSYRPIDCLLHSRDVHGVFPTPSKPSHKIKILYSLNDEQIQIALLNAGVKNSLDDLSSEDVYRILNMLPSRDPEGKVANKFYRWLIKTTDFDIDFSGTEYKKYMKSGYMWSKCSKIIGYLPTSEVYHIDIEGIPPGLMKHLATSMLPKKRGALKVKSFFGIEVIDKSSIQERMIHHTVAACSVDANACLQKSKEYISFYRHQQSMKVINEDLFSQLNLTVCTEFSNEIVYNKITEVHSNQPGSYTFQEGTLYVVCDELKDNDATNSLLANTIGDAIASIFELIEGTPFAQLYSCAPEDKPQLLTRMLGDDFDGDMPTALLGFKEESMAKDDFLIIPEGALDTKSVDTDTTPQTNDGVNNTPNKPISESDDIWNVPENMIIEPKLHVAQDSTSFVGTKVSGGRTSGGGSVITVSRKSSGEVGEQLAMLFERKQGRFPVRVGHITGYNAPGCDILSFTSINNFDKFMAGDYSSKLIARFIDAKEKRSGGRVKISLNEVNAAERRKERYYLYRFRKIIGSPFSYNLTLLNNPLYAGDNVVSSRIEVSLEHALGAKEFNIYDETVDS